MDEWPGEQNSENHYHRIENRKKNEKKIKAA